MKKLLIRILGLIPALLVQGLWIWALLRWLSPWATAINLGLSALAVVFVLFIITKNDEDTYKILWLLAIVPFPVFGALLYLMFGNKRTTLPLRKRLEVVDEKVLAHPGPSRADQIADRRVRQTFEVMESMSGFPTMRCEDATYYPLGDDAFPHMLEDLEAAERFIFVEYFIVEHGEMLDAMLKILERKAAEGVDVRFLYDDFGSISTFSLAEARALRARGIKCYAFNPMITVRGTLNYRDHRKMLVIDDRVAYTGGVNLADEYINRKERFGIWKDTALRLTGKPVRSYTRMFVEFWDAFTKVPVPFELYGSVADGVLAGESPMGVSEPHGVPADEASDGFVLSYYDSPIAKEDVSNELYIGLLSQAQDHAYFYTPYLLLGDDLLHAFRRAARRGVDVRIIMPGIPDKKLVFRMSRSFYQPLLEAGVKIFEYEPGFVHAKGCMVDGKIATVGTVNLDYRSLFLHFENNALFYGSSVIEQEEQDFLATQALSRQMVLGYNVRTSVASWVVNGVLRVFAPLC